MSIDRREDAGDFYPGGKVISTRPVATGGDVKHSDFEDLDVKTNTIPDLREAVRELGRRLGATVVTALSACVAVAATVQTVPVNDLDFDANPSIVTNVVFDGLATTGDVNRVERQLDDKANITAIENIARAATATNALQDAATESNRVNIASNRVAISTLSDSKLDLAGGTMTGPLIINASQGRADFLTCSINGESRFRFYSESGTGAPCLEVRPGTDITARTFTFPRHDDGTLALTSDIPTVPTDVSAFNNDAGYLMGESDPSVKAWAKAATKPTYTAAEVGATTPADVTAAIREQSLGGIWDAELEVWWTPRMRNGNLTYEATTNVNLNAVN